MQLLDRIFVPGGGIRAARHRILVVNGHPDPRPARFCSALCDAYEEGARSAGWTVRRLTVGCLASGPAGLRNGCSQETALEDIAWATQLFVVFPLWSDQPPQSYATCSRNMSRSTGWTGGLCPSDRFAWSLLWKCRLSSTAPCRNAVRKRKAWAGPSLCRDSTTRSRTLSAVLPPLRQSNVDGGFRPCGQAG
jgi:hypothetical protein